MGSNLFIDFIRKKAVWIIAFFAMLFLLLHLLDTVNIFSSSKKELRETVSNQKHTIEQVVKQNQELTEQLQVQKKVEQESKKDLIQHIENKEKKKQEYKDIHSDLLDSIAQINKGQTEKITEEQSKKPTEDKNVKKEKISHLNKLKNITKLTSKENKKQLAKSEAKTQVSGKYQREKRVVYAVQDALWQAYNA